MLIGLTHAPGDNGDDDDDDDDDDKTEDVSPSTNDARRLGDELNAKSSASDRHGKLVQDILRQQNEEQRAQTKSSDGTAFDYF